MIEYLKRYAYVVGVKIPFTFIYQWQLLLDISSFSTLTRTGDVTHWHPDTWLQLWIGHLDTFIWRSDTGMPWQFSSKLWTALLTTCISYCHSDCYTVLRVTLLYLQLTFYRCVYVWQNKPWMNTQCVLSPVFSDCWVLIYYADWHFTANPLLIHTRCMIQAPVRPAG